MATSIKDFTKHSNGAFTANDEIGLLNAIDSTFNKIPHCRTELLSHVEKLPESYPFTFYIREGSTAEHIILDEISAEKYSSTISSIGDFVKISKNCYRVKNEKFFKIAMKEHFMKDKRFSSFSSLEEKISSVPSVYPVTFYVKDEIDITDKIYIKIVKEKDDIKKFEYHQESYSVARTCNHKKGDNVRGGSTVIQNWRLQELGDYGWEMCGATYDGTWSKYFFKREK